jgi:hypothetical protein
VGHALNLEDLWPFGLILAVILVAIFWREKPPPAT